MATRMQQRRGTASQWVSSNAGAGPILNAGEIGWESDTNKFKIGDGVNNWASLDYFADINSTANPAFGTSITFEGATADSYETIIQVTDPTADRTITFPDSSGTVALTTDIAAGTVTETGTQTLTNKTLTSPVVSGLTLSDGSIVLEGATANDFETTLTVTDPTADRTITFPDATGTVAFTDSPTFTTTVKLPSSVEGPTSSTSVNMFFGSGAANLTFGGGQTTGNLTIGGGANRTTGVIGIGTGATASGTKTIDIGTASTGGTTAITVGSSSGATSNITLNGTVTAANNLVVTGDLTVNGTTTTINSTTLAVDDKNIVIGDVATPSDTTADGGGITLKGLTDKTFNWLDATDSWTSSEHINLASGKSYSMNGTALKDVSETLSNKTLASAIATTAFTLNATAELRLADTDSTHYVGFKAPGTVTTNKIWTLPAADGAAGQVLTTDGSGVFSFSTPAAGAAFSELMLIGA
jgi:hypothetical protein